MAETLQDKIDYFTKTSTERNQDYYWRSIEPAVNKAIQELREAVLLTLMKDGVNSYTINSVLALIGEKK